MHTAMLKLMMSRFNITPDGSQQIHIAFGTNEPDSSRHPCLRLGSLDDLQTLRQRIWDHHVKGGPAAPMAVDKPGEAISGEIFTAPAYVWRDPLMKG